MNIHDMTEVAYKNGYEAGVKESQAEIERLQKQENTVAKMHYKRGMRDFAKRVKEEINFPLAVWKVFDNILKEMVGDKNANKI